MAIKIDGQSKTINDFYVKDSGGNTHPVTLFEKNGVVVYARPGLLEMVRPSTSLPTHVTSLAASRDYTLEPSASTGPLTPIEEHSSYYRVYHGDVLTFIPTPEANWKIDSYTSQATLNFLTDTKVYGNMKIEPVSVSRIMHNVDIQPAANSNFKVNYYNDAGNWVTAQGTAAGSVSAWQGQTVSWSASANTFYKYAANPGGSFTLTSATTISYNAPAKAERTLKLWAGDHASITVTYDNVSDQTITYTADHINTYQYDLWQGSTVSYGLAVDDYCNYTISTSSLGATSSTAAITVNVSAKQRSLAVQNNSGNVDDFTVYYKDADFDDQDYTVRAGTSVGSIIFWQGSSVTYSYTQPGYYAVDVVPTTVAAGSSNVSMTVTSTPLYRDLNFTLSDGVAKINARDGSTTYSISSNQTLSVWQGYEWTFGAVRSTYWTNATVSPASAAKGAATINITSSATPYTRSFLYGATHTTSVTLTYYTDAANQTTTHPTNTVTYFTAWTGGSIEYSWTGATYYLPGSGSVDASEDIRAVNIQPQRKPSTVEITGTSHRTITITGKDVNNSTLTHSASDESASWDDYWSGAKVDWTVDYEQYWTGTETGGSIAASEDTRTIDVSATKAPRNLYLYPSSRATIQAWYDNINPGGGYLKADHADASIDNLWQGGSVSDYRVTTDDYCTYTATAANLNTSESDASITANVTGLTRTLTARSGSNIKTFEVTYQDSNFTTHTVSISDAVTHTYAAWQGHEITYSCTAYSYYTASVDASGLGIGDNAASIVVEGDLLYRNIVLTMNTGVKSVYFDATGDLSGGDVTYTQSGTYSVWQGYQYSLRAFADTYYQSPTVSTDTISKGSATAYVTASVSKKAGTVRVLGSKPTGLSYLNLSSTTIDDQSWTTRATAAATYTSAVWSGAAVDWTAVYLSGYTGDSSGSVAAAEGIRDISWPTVLAKYYVDYKNNTGTTAIVDSVSIAVGTTYRFRYPAATTITIKGGSAQPANDTLSIADSGTTRSIAIESTSKFMGSVYKNPGDSTLTKTKTFYAPDGAPAYIAKSNWSLTNIYGGKATISSHGGGGGGYDQITVKLSDTSVGSPANVDVYFSPVQQTVIRGGSAPIPSDFWAGSYSNYWVDEAILDDGEVNLIIGIQNKTAYSVNFSININSYLNFPDDQIDYSGMYIGGDTTIGPNSTGYVTVDIPTSTGYHDVSEADSCEIIFTAYINNQNCGDGWIYEI